MQKFTWLAVASVLAVPGCANDASTPAPTGVASVRRFTSVNGYSSGGQITVHTDAGDVTLNLNDASMTLPSGQRVEEIPAEALATLATTLQHIVDDPAGQLELMLQMNPPPAQEYDPDPPPGDPFPGEGGSCGDHECATLRAPAVPRGSIEPTSRRSSLTSGPRKPWTVTSSASPRIMPVDAPRLAVESPCREIATFIYEKTAAWRNAKTAYKASQAALLVYIANNFENGIISYTAIAKIGALVIAHDLAAREVIAGTIELNFMAIQYRQFGCWSSGSGNWNSGGTGTSGVTTLGGGTREYGWVCSTRLVNDKDGWPVPVETCEYMFAA